MWVVWHTVAVCSSGHVRGHVDSFLHVLVQLLRASVTHGADIWYVTCSEITGLWWMGRKSASAVDCCIVSTSTRSEQAARLAHSAKTATRCEEMGTSFGIPSRVASNTLRDLRSLIVSPTTPAHSHQGGIRVKICVLCCSRARVRTACQHTCNTTVSSAH